MFSYKLDTNTKIGLIEERHAEEFFALVQRNQERLLHWCPWLGEVGTIEKTREFLKSKLERFANGNGFTAGFFENGALIGVIALEYVDRANRVTEIGYWLSAETEGKGLIIRSCPVLIDYAFSQLKLQRIQIRCASENVRSRVIPEKLGFRQEGVLRQTEKLHNRFVDLVVYGILADEWKKFNQAS